MLEASFVIVKEEFILEPVPVRNKICDRLTWFLACLLVVGCNCLIVMYRRLKSVLEKGGEIIPLQGMDVLILLLVIP